jgi:hypothetical protein
VPTAFCIASTTGEVSANSGKGQFNKHSQAFAFQNSTNDQSSHIVGFASGDVAGTSYPSASKNMTGESDEMALKRTSERTRESAEINMSIPIWEWMMG